MMPFSKRVKNYCHNNFLNNLLKFMGLSISTPLLISFMEVIRKKAMIILLRNFGTIWKGTRRMRL
jgi:hypothetical protein